MAVPWSQFDVDAVRMMSLESTGALAGVERWHHAQAAGKGSLAALRRASPGGPSRTDNQIPDYARALRAEASARLGVLHAKSPKRAPRAA